MERNWRLSGDKLERKWRETLKKPLKSGRKWGKIINVDMCNKNKTVEQKLN